MLNPVVTSLSFRRMIRVGGSYRTSPSTSGIKGPVARGLVVLTSTLVGGQYASDNLKKHVLRVSHAVSRAHAS